MWMNRPMAASAEQSELARLARRAVERESVVVEEDGDPRELDFSDDFFLPDEWGDGQ